MLYNIDPNLLGNHLVTELSIGVHVISRVIFILNGGQILARGEKRERRTYPDINDRSRVSHLGLVLLSTGAVR